MSFDHEFDIGLVLQDGGYFSEDLFGLIGDVIAAGLEEQLIGDVDKYDAFIDLDVDILVIEVSDGTLEVHDQCHVQGILP